MHLRSFCVLLAVVASTSALSADAQTLSRRMTSGNRRSGVYEVAFSDAEEAVLKGNQGQPAESIARLLEGRSLQEVQRRCVELGLRCGDSVSAPIKGSEKWRTGRRGQ